MRRFPVTVTILAVALAASADQHIRLLPKFTPGQIFRYEIETRTTTSSKTTTPIVDPGGATQATQSISLLVRLDVLQAAPAAKNSLPGSIRLRATYEKSKATSSPQGATRVRRRSPPHATGYKVHLLSVISRVSSTGTKSRSGWPAKPWPDKPLE